VPHLAWHANQFKPKVSLIFIDLFPANFYNPKIEACRKPATARALEVTPSRSGPRAIRVVLGHVSSGATCHPSRSGPRVIRVILRHVSSESFWATCHPSRSGPRVIRGHVSSESFWATCYPSRFMLHDSCRIFLGVS
jgi:hypothetical protein